jgi:hypothetical protein
MIMTVVEAFIRMIPDKDSTWRGDECRRHPKTVLG